MVVEKINPINVFDHVHFEIIVHNKIFSNVKKDLVVYFEHVRIHYNFSINKVNKEEEKHFVKKVVENFEQQVQNFQDLVAKAEKVDQNKDETNQIVEKIKVEIADQVDDYQKN